MKFLLVVLSLVSLIVFAQSQTIYQAAQNTPSLSSLVSLINTNGSALIPYINGTASPSTNYTVIAPDNFAVGNVQFNQGAYPSANATLFYHVSQTVVTGTLPLDTSFTSLLSPLPFRVNNYVSPYNTILTVNGNPVNTTATASNGEIFIVNTVLYPSLGGLTIALNAMSANFSTFSNVYANLTVGAQNILNGNPITIFAPVNSALNAVNLTGYNQVQISELILNHAVNLSVALFSAAFPASLSVPTYDGGSLTVVSNTTGVFITSQGGATAQVLLPNIVFNGGVIHGIGAVLTPSNLPNTTITLGGTTAATTSSSTTGAATTGAATTGGTTATTTSSASFVALSFLALLAALLWAF